MTTREKKTTVIVGGGHAAGALMTTLLQKKYQHEVVLVGEEPHPPYQRPPLSKNYLAGEVEQASLYLKPRAVYEKAGQQLRLGVRVEQIDRDNKTIRLSDQSTLKYDQLVLATGSHVRRLKAPGADLQGIHYLHDIADTDALREQLVPGKRLVIVGGGYIGLEVAASAIKKGVNVTVLEAADRLMQRVTGPEMSAFFYAKHIAAGVDVRLNTAVTGFEAGDQGRVAGVTLADGGTVPADVVLVSIGVIPETTLAEAAGLPCDDGLSPLPTRLIRHVLLLRPSWARRNPTIAPRGSGPTSMMFACRWWGCRKIMISVCCAAAPKIRNLRCSISARAVSLLLTRSICRLLSWLASSWFSTARVSALKH